jgi:ATP-binding cassette, subfamily B, multidrug efflux pump
VKFLWRLTPYMKRHWLPALLAPLFMALEVAMDLAQPRLLQTIVDTGLPHNDLPLVIHTGWIMIVVGIVGLIGGVACGIFATIAGLAFGTDIRGQLFRKIQSLSFGNLERLETGRLITRLTNDIDQVQEAALMFMRILVRAPLLMVGSLIMAVLTDPQLSLLLLVISPFLILTLTVVSRRGHTLFLAVQERLDRLNVVMQENLAGVRVVKAFVREDHERARFADRNEAFMDRTIRASTLVAVVMPIMMLLVNFGVVGVIWFGGWQVQAGRTHVGQLLAFINYLLQMLGSLMMVGMLVMRVAQADASAERIAEVLASEPEVPEPVATAPLGEVRGKLEFDHVEFSYDGEEAELVLRDVSFTAEPGQTVAILGATGSGKSTLAHLVPRFFDVTAGQVRIDGVDVRELRLDDLRHEVALVLQDTILFSGSIRDNIRYGRPEASDEEVEAAARHAQAEEFITGLPEGYETALGQRGVNLSGGQKQRLAIARALLCRPAVLIFDDCTSAVDAATEQLLMQALHSPDNPSTKLIVAQRVGSVLNADQILVLEDGVIAAAGTHRQLLETSPVYREIVRSQLDEGEVAHAG